ncbi:ras association domain-containing protein 1-like isoform X4 [Watersipora subatra]|uniref:ras association domain-containing protein 1-like isoform X4 n=1 Tax=Watersipora subatra TaxID=2589382 RepID=UPI00355BD7BE
MELSQADHSASQFGVKLRRVASEKSSSIEKVNLSGRKSTPGVLSNCENRSNHRRSVLVPNQVALRQEIAEKQAIERQKKSGSHSWDKRSKPSLPPKPILKSSSLGNLSKPSSGGLKRSVVQRKSPLVLKSDLSPAPMIEEPQMESVTPNISSKPWFNFVYEWYDVYRPMLETLYQSLSERAHRQAMVAHQHYLDYQKAFNKEARKWRNERLRRRTLHGHRFLAVGIAEPSWCDLCAHIVWGRSTVCLQCVNCKFKCHTGCEDVIQNSCPGPEADKRHEDDDMWTHRKTHQDVDDTDSGYSGSGGSAGFTLTKEEICSKIQAYNKSVGLASGAMTLPATDSDSFKGNIKVCVCITRPINMSLSSRPTSIYEALHREAELSPQASPSNTVVTHEQIPQNAVVSLHTDSCDTAIEVVSILLNKFKITDNPKSFALFEQTIQNEKEVKLRKVGDQERPLLNYLRWITESNESKRFVLKENDSGDIMYEAFSIPELNNFLRVLEHEEAERLTEIQNKYLVRRKQLSDRLRELQPEKNSNSKTVR